MDTYIVTERRTKWLPTPASYSEDPELKSRLGDRLSSLRLLSEQNANRFNSLRREQVAVDD